MVALIFKQPGALQKGLFLLLPEILLLQFFKQYTLLSKLNIQRLYGIDIGKSIFANIST